GEVPGQKDVDQLDTKKRDDWSSAAASAPAISGNAEPPQTALADNKFDPPKETSQPAAARDNSFSNLSDPPTNTESSVPPTKHRRRHHSSDPAVAATGDNSIPTLNDPAAGPSDSAPKSDLTAQSGAPAPATSPATAAPGPSLGNLDDHGPSKTDTPLTSQAATPGPTETGKKEDSTQPATARDNSLPNLSDPPTNTESSVPPTKHRRRHHSPDPAVAATGDNSIPTLNDPAAGPSDSAPKSDRTVQSGNPAPATSPATAAPGPSLGNLDDHGPSKTDTPLTSQAATPGPTETGKKEDSTAQAIHDPAPLKDVAAEAKTDRPAEKAAPAGGGDIFGALQDPPAEKHELKGPEPGATVAGDHPADTAPPKHRRNRKPPEPDAAAPGPLRTAEQNPASEPVGDAKPQEALKAEDRSAPVASHDVPPLKDVAPELKTDRAPDKQASAAVEHDAFGGPKDAAPEKHEHDSTGPEPPANGAGTNPADPVPHQHRRKKQPVDAESPSPNPILTAEKPPANEPAAGTKPEPTVQPEAPKLTETPKPVASEAPKMEPTSSDLKVNEPKPAEPPAVAGPSLDAAAPPKKTEPKPEIVAATPSNVPAANVPAANLPLSNLVPHPAAEEEPPQANVSFARRMPEKNDAGNSLTYKIVVRNNGAKAVKLVEVDEAVPPDHLVQTTEPSAETHDQTLHWSLRDLGPHEERTITITLAAPPPPQPIVRTAAIPKSERAEEEHALTAKPEEPAKLPHMELELIAPATLSIGESCRIGFRVTNLGPKVAGLKLHLDLPTQIHFQRGQQLLYKVGALDENESREDYLTATVTGPGIVVVRGEIVLDGQTVVAAKATCKIAGVQATQKARPKRDGLVVPAGATEVAPQSAAPCNCGP
ncbi:MAG TPA: hypothetical protein VMR25_03225, partial [Planctomycetaceae bacterium]|nr:hypothetical protein [Planctomycetaceae bacterium]